jgi:hypothetical protein
MARRKGIVDGNFFGKWFIIEVSSFCQILKLFLARLSKAKFLGVGDGSGARGCHMLGEGIRDQIGKGRLSL